MNSPLLEKSLDFSTQIVLYYEEFSKSKKDTTIAKQLLRSATSVGANINEAIYGNSKADFISKLHISLKETGESIYWLKLLKNTKLVNSMTTVLYPLVAENYEVSSESVERSIRTAIQLAWDRGNPEAFSKYFGYNSQVRKKRPTNAEFIARISDEIRIKYNVS